MPATWLPSCYRLVAELLLHPEDRDASRVDGLLERLEDAPPEVAGPIGEFLAHPAAHAPDEYVQTLELAPPCPLYLGGYLFDEPTTCRGAGTSGRNAYMLELTGIYRHFGFELSARELPDYLPVMADFLWISLEHRARDRLGLRRRFVEQYVRPALAPLREKLDEYQSPYARLVTALQSAVDADLHAMGEEPAWRPPEPRTEARGRRLPVLDDAASSTPRPTEAQR